MQGEELEHSVQYAGARTPLAGYYIGQYKPGFVVNCDDPKTYYREKLKETLSKVHGTRVDAMQARVTPVSDMWRDQDVRFLKQWDCKNKA